MNISTIMSPWMTRWNRGCFSATFSLSPGADMRADMRLNLPDTICFRVTRQCNARCGFCLAPADGEAADDATLRHRLDWLLSHGVKTIHFCGGEPTIHPALPDLLMQVHARGGKNRITTNAIEISEPVLSTLRATKAQVKVSLHGDRAYHNQMVGCDAFDRTVGNLRRLIAAGIPTSVQTTVVANGTRVLDGVIDFCLGNGVTRLSVLPFLPRGNGNHRREEYEFTVAQRSALQDLVKKERRALGARLDLRWLNLTACRIHVVEVDGRILREGPTEARDGFVYRIPPLVEGAD
jgi:MoaA/NifB/PqqE/SkfB family radical SAM enzyme